MPLSSMQVDPRVDGTVAPALTKDSFTGVNEALAKLAHQAANDTPDAPPRAPAPDRSADARISPSPAAATLGPAELSTQIPREQRSLGKRGILMRVAILLCVGVGSFWGWRSYGDAARDMVANWASPLGWISARLSAEQALAPHPAPEQVAAPTAVATPAPPLPQAASPAPSQAASIAQPATTAVNEAMARDLAALRQTVEQLAAGQEQLTREIAKLQAAKPDKPPAKKPEKRVPARVSTAGRGSDVFDPAQNPTAPGVPRSLGSIVLRRGSPRRRATPPRQRRGRRKRLLGS